MCLVQKQQFVLVNKHDGHMQVVPEASSYPGYGEFVLLEGVDHINVCKPPHKTDPAYVKLMEFLKFRVQESRKSTELQK